MVCLLDAYHLGDPLFVTGLARDLAARRAGLVLVHGSAERGERALEALGRFPEAAEGVWQAEDEEGREAVERALRDLNREIAHEVNEAGVASIRMMAGDRGLVRREGDGLATGRTGWLADLVASGVTVVVGALLADGTEADPAVVAGRLALALGVPLLALATKGGADAPGALADAAGARRASGIGADVRAGLRASLRQTDLSSPRISMG